MPDVLARAATQVIVVDGAMGTMLTRMGLPPGEPPELLNVTAPEMIAQVHADYLMAGAHAVSTNSFGGSRPKLAKRGIGDQVVELNRAAVRIARQSGAAHVLADVGPTGLTIAPTGPASFDEVYAAFAEQIAALSDESPDAMLLETFTDLAEARAALLAARDVTDIPVLVSLSYGLSGRTELSGTDPETAATVFEALGASAIGMNCGLGPAQMLPLVERLCAATSLPVIAQPNAGMPRLEDGVTVFPGTPAELAAFAADAARAGAAFVGSCCGSTPSFTGEIALAVDGAAPRAHGPSGGHRGVAVASARSRVTIGAGSALRKIGERINPTGKKVLADSLREGSMSVIREYAVAQEHAGADLLDVNVGAAGIDAVAVLPEAVLALTALTGLPLVIDTTDPVALEAALRAYPGRALVNSVNGGAGSLAAVLPPAKRYGAAVIVLALDDDGIPDTAEGRVSVVRRVREAAHAAGLTDRDLVVDGLVLTAAAEPGAAATTLDTVSAVSESGLVTVLGVSNVSHGLPGRPELNATFLAMARARGLDAAIVNPGDDRIMTSIAASDALLGRDERAARWIARVAAEEARKTAAPAVAGAAEGRESAPGRSSEDTAPAAAQAATTVAETLARAIDAGDVDAAPGLVVRLVADGMAPAEVIGAVMTPAIQRLGDAYGRGEVFLPQMMSSAEAMKAGVVRAKQLMGEGEAHDAGRVVFATVKGDIHSIGKDICISLLESRGFAVEDLGVDVAPELVTERAAEADAVCLSALMTTTLPAMEATVAAVRAATPDVPVLVGGAVVTAEYAETIGATGYAADAPGCVEAVTSRTAAGKASAS